MAFVTPCILPRLGLSVSTTPLCPRSTPLPATQYAPLDIQAAKHVQFKGAKKSERTRPRKHRPSDRNRKAPPFNPSPMLEEGLPPVLEVFKPDQIEGHFQGEVISDIAMMEKVKAEEAVKQEEADKLEEVAMKRASVLLKERRIAAKLRRKEAYATKKATREAEFAARAAAISEQQAADKTEETEVTEEAEEAEAEEKTEETAEVQG